MLHAHNSLVRHHGVAAERPARVTVSASTRHSENKNWGPPTHRFRQLDEIAPFWRMLERDTASPIQQYLWSESCCATLPLDGKIHFFVAKTGSQTGAIAPLFRTKSVLGRLEHLGVKVLREPADLLFSDPVALQSLANALVKLGSPLFLDRIPADSPTVAAAQARKEEKLVFVLHVSGNFEDPRFT